MDTYSDRENQQIDPEKMLRKKDEPSDDDDQISCPSTQPLPRRGFLGASPDPEHQGGRLSSLSSSDIGDVNDDDATYLSRSYGTPTPGQFRQQQRMDLSPRKEIAERNKTKLKKKRVMSTTTSFSPGMSSPGPGSPFESPMITSITKGVRLPPTQDEGDREEYMLRREQQIDPEKQLFRRDHHLDDLREESPQAPSTGPLPRRAIPERTGSLKPKVLFLDPHDSEEDGDTNGDEELTFGKEKVASAGSTDSGALEEREKRLEMLEQTLAAELEELRMFKQRLMEKEAELDEREKGLSA